MNDQALQLIRALHRGGTYGYWWTDAGRQSFWWEVGKETPLPSGKRNVYVGVHPTRVIPETNRHGEPAESRAVRSRIEHIAAVNCLFAEFDAKDFGGDMGATLAHIDALEPAPTATVRSGGGYHCYWLLEQPWVLTTDAERQRAVKLQAAWVRLMGGDDAAKDLARVLRVPGTFNQKYTPPRPVETVYFSEDRRYTLEALAGHAAPFVETDRKPLATNGAAPHDRYAAAALAGELARVATVPDGHKHLQLYKSSAALGELAAAGALTDEASVKDALLNVIAPRAADVKGAIDTINDGFAKGKTNPRKLPERRDFAPHRDEAQFTVPDLDGDWRTGIVSAAALQRMVFPDLRWVVDSLLPEGATLLAGKPKAKKSWLALGIAVSVATGGQALGKLDVVQGRVLYLDLESNQRRMRSRLNAMLGNAPWPEAFHVATKWPRGPEAIAQLEAWMQVHPDTVLIVADILQNIRPRRDPKANPYDEDYEAVKPFNEFAEKHHVAMIIIHHTRKAKADDVFDEISGSTGLVGGVASMWVIGRAPDSATESVFAMRGRDLLDDEPLALTWDSYYCRHMVAGNAVDYAVSSERRAVLEVMDDDAQYTPKELAAQCGKSVTAINKLLAHLCDSHAVERVGYGKYAKVRETRETRDSRESGETRESFQGEVSQKSPQLSHSPMTLPSPMGEFGSHTNGLNSPKNGSLPTLPSFLEIVVARENGHVVWKLWDSMTDTALGTYDTEAAARAAREAR